MGIKSHRRNDQRWMYCALLACLGISVGFLIGNSITQALCRNSSCCSLGNKDIPVDFVHPQSTPGAMSEQGSDIIGALPDMGSGPILVGVMTAKKYISTRIHAIRSTWAHDIPGSVLYFSSADTLTTDFLLPVVSLDGVDDSYPPQKKAFMMLKYMHDHFAEQYEWFVRADDDVYIKGDRLAKFLSSVNSSRTQYLGQAGQGKGSEIGQLSLNAGENFCMGGPAVVFSRASLRYRVNVISGGLIAFVLYRNAASFGDFVAAT